MIKQLTFEEIQALPKVELHLHLDCSLSFDLVSQLKSEISFKEYKMNDLANTLKTIPKKLFLPDGMFFI